MPNIRQRAMQALVEDENLSKQKVEEAKERDRLRRLGILKDRLRGIGIVANPEDIPFEIEGLSFNLHVEDLVLEEPCERCKETRRSYPIRSLSDIGKWIKGEHRIYHEHIWSQ